MLEYDRGPPPPKWITQKWQKMKNSILKTSSEGVASFVKGYNLSYGFVLVKKTLAP